MAQRPIEADMTGKAPVVSSAIPRAQYAALRETAAEQGLTVSALIRQMIGQGLGQLECADTGPP